MRFRFSIRTCTSSEFAISGFASFVIREFCSDYRTLKLNFQRYNQISPFFRSSGVCSDTRILKLNFQRYKKNFTIRISFARTCTKKKSSGWLCAIKKGFVFPFTFNDFTQPSKNSSSWHQRKTPRKVRQTTCSL